MSVTPSNAFSANYATFSAEGAIKRSEGAITGVAVVFLQTLSSILAVHAVTAAVT